ncbi:hypothetical protein SAMN00777080_3308 [Aquiflexum balticum DSM 16537]|uniref:Uncharacterized protein n=1 Tax=Aquiflexum balticum DSM 16537 TaxID=758820 RepID=A0A1W2H7P2_9BACT|nr:hypothetical protein [Aquiflexum balticum]SMD44682.1 hypothetical protein SAMN00777080_3308 [Aquiflexum balticum DSM 16537]
MRSLHPLRIIFLVFFLISCSETENPITDFGLDYQPLEIGLYWEYEVNEIIVFGEGDEELSDYFLRDRIEYSYINAEGEPVFVVKREKSENRTDWIAVGNYSMQHNDFSLIRNFENSRTVNLVFPPQLDKAWDSQVLNAEKEDEFRIEFMGTITVGEQSFSRSIRVLQEEDDDEITFRDNRYEVFSKGIGLVEQYYEVFTYCSRNDCLGQMLIDSGRFTHMKILTYGKL